MQKARTGFTLAEVLVTLAIIGVVAALTIPTLIASTNTTKYTSAMKKNLANLNSVLQTNIARDSINASTTGIASGVTLAEFFLNGSPTSVLDTSTNFSILKYDHAVNYGYAVGDTVYLADGARLTFKIASGTGCGAVTPSAFDPTAANSCYVVVDTNGDKLPNTVSTTANPSDIWVLAIGPTQVYPVTLTAAVPTVAGFKGIDNVTTPYNGTAGTIPIANSASFDAMTIGSN